MPFGNPEREKSFRCRSTHFFAKASIFSFCVGVFIENANTEVARKHKSKKFLLSATPPAQQNFKQKRFCFPRLPPKRAVEAPAPTEKEKTFSSSACRAW
ncbi:MAG: hypothetical protein E7605_03520 [Ruminococcaceae bacterium]|nr:hypothetical protein [Oscillospiraceae bacterium]